MRFERLNYEKGWQRLFYITESGEAINPLPSVHCYSPEKVNTNFNELKSLELGVYYFDFYFKRSGKYVFVCFENSSPSMIIVATVKR